MATNPVSELSDEVRRLLEKSKEENVAHEELGTLGFREAQEIIDSMHRIILNILDLLDRYGPTGVPDGVATRGLIVIRTELKAISNAVEQIHKLAGADKLHTDSYPNQKSAQIENLERIQERLESGTIGLNQLLQYSRIQATLDDIGLDRLREAKNDAAEVHKILTNVRAMEAERGAKEGELEFGGRARDHQRMEKRWFWALVLSATSLIGIIGWIYLSDTPTWPPELLVSKLIKRLLVLSVPAIALRVSLGKYNLERNLSILYRHRQTVLSQFSAWENAIGEDLETKNQFRLEVARLIFSDPVTGYVRSDAGTELNVNPVVSSLEKFGAAGKGLRG